ncbi:MAG: ATP-binding cassette domain-containing protein, partial [Desulfamplus sp.]|nr:ATP-binding cassette domain-containing protein [Desulfamplus sp.]
MQSLLKTQFRYFFPVCFFGMCVNLLYLSLPVYIMVVYDKVLISFSTETLTNLTIGVLIALAAMGLLDYFRSRIMIQAGTDLEEKMITPVLTFMLKDAALQTGVGYERGLQDLGMLKNSIAEETFFRLPDLPWIAVYIAVLFFMHTTLALIALIGIVTSFIFHFFLRLLIKKRYVLSDIILFSGNRSINEYLDHAETISGMGMAQGIIKKYTGMHMEAIKLDYDAAAYKAGIKSVIKTINTITATAVFGAGVHLYFANEITSGIMMAAIPVTLRLFYPLVESLHTLKASIEAAAAYKRIRTYINTSQSRATFTLPAPQGKISIEKMTFILKGKPLLQNISFSVEPGETLGIVGPSGSGKTVLLKLLLGIWPATAGKVKIDESEISQWQNEELGKYVGYHPQNIELFSGRIDENIAGFKTVVPENIIEAAKKAGAHEMILQLPDGYNTWMEKQGKNLSGGQRKIISTARALYNNPPIVVMDEPHAGLDEIGLKLLLQTMLELKKEKTTLIIVTDRINLLRNTDKILVMND